MHCKIRDFLENSKEMILSFLNQKNHRFIKAVVNNIHQHRIHF